MLHIGSMSDRQDKAPYKNVIKSWSFVVDRKNASKHNELVFGRVKAFLYESLYRSITRHDLGESFQLIRLLPKEFSLDPYVLFRFIMILVESNRADTVGKNVLIYLESLVSKLRVSKPDVFVEFLCYFIRHNRLNAARELFSLRHNKMLHLTHRPVPYVDTNLRCYEFLLNYLEWKEKVEISRSKVSFDVSTQGWVVNAINKLRFVTSNHEYFVMCLLEVLLYYGYHQKAYLFASEFQRNNPDNLSAQLIHLNLLKYLSTLTSKEKPVSLDEEVTMLCEFDEETLQKNRLEDLEGINNFSTNNDEIDDLNINNYPFESDKRTILKNLKRLDCSRHELLDYGAYENLIDLYRDLMDGLEYVHEIKNVSRWSSLHKVLNEIFDSKDEALIMDARFIWHSHYKRYWKNVNFIAICGDRINEEDKNLITEVCDLFNKHLDRPIK